MIHESGLSAHCSTPSSLHCERAPADGFTPSAYCPVRARCARQRSRTDQRPRSVPEERPRTPGVGRFVELGSGQGDGGEADGVAEQVDADDVVVADSEGEQREGLAVASDEGAGGAVDDHRVQLGGECPEHEGLLGDGGRALHERQVNSIYATQRYDIELTANSGAPQFDSRAQSIAADTPGIARVEPILETSVEHGGSTYAAFGMTDNPLYRYDLRAGRW